MTEEAAKRPSPGVQGWRQFLASKLDILDKFDLARARSRHQRAQTRHGVVLEAAVRKWLASFLPRKFGVTSGYVVSQGKRDGFLPHFDVIVYDALESPVLWIDDSDDASIQGQHRAVLAEHVKAVLEVKSSLNASTSKEAIDHLHQLSPLLESSDDDEARYKRYLPRDFFSGVVFAEARKDDQFSVGALDNLIARPFTRGHFVGLVLRGESLPSERTGTIQLVGGEKPIYGTVRRGSDSLLSERALSNSSSGAADHHYAAMLTWGDSQFAMFAFDMLAMLNGTFEPGTLSSLHGVGWYDPEIENEGSTTS